MSLRFLLPIALVLGLAIPAAAQPPTIPTMDPEELRPGMTGYGLTVFSGGVPERFDVEIKGVLAGFAGGEGLIIIEADHPELKDIGAVGGMSGSPIFIDDKLIGALAYGWGFSRRPLCGVTPIRKMFDVYDLVTDESPVDPTEMNFTREAWPEAWDALGGMKSELPGTIRLREADLAAAGMAGLASSAGTMELQPLGMPLLVNTRSPLVMQYLDEFFAGTLVHPVMSGMQTGGGGRAENSELTAADLANGSALSVLLVDGDIQIAGMGTATYVEGDRVIGFGHPMFGMGPVDAPIYVSEVVTVIPSIMRPFKLGNIAAEVGALRQDRLWAIGGTLSSRAELIPMTFALDFPETGTKRDYNFRIWRDRQYTPMLAFICLIDSVDAGGRLMGPMNVRFDYQITLEDGRKVSRSEYQSAPDMAAVMAGFQFMDHVRMLMNNRFEAVNIASFDMSMSIAPQTRVMMLNRVTRGRTQLEPGSTLRGEIEYLQWRDEPARFPFEVALPETLRPGSYEVHVIDSRTRLMLERNFRPELTRIESFDDLLRAQEPSFPSDTLYILLIEPSEAMTIDGRRIDNVPSSVAGLVRSTARAPERIGSARGRLLSEQRVVTDAAVAGSIVMQIQVVDPGAPPPPAAPPPGMPIPMYF